MSADGTELTMDPPGSMAWRVFSRPRMIAWVGMGSVVLLGAAYLMAMVVDMSGRTDMSTAGPGMWIFNGLSEFGALGALGGDLLRTLCTIDGTSLVALGGGSSAISAFPLILAMWVAMACAMMLPTAAPMISTYCEIADTAARKRIPVVSPLILMSGYLAVWLLFAVAAAAVQVLLASFAQLDGGFVIRNGYLAAGILGVAGLYQFTELKMACLSKCRTPFPFFMANWTDRVAGVFRLGLRQGIVCVLCCWALMLVMFAAGLMNVVWMSVLAVVMLAEKVLPRPRIVSRSAGAVLLIWAGGLLVNEVLY